MFFRSVLLLGITSCLGSNAPDIKKMSEAFGHLIGKNIDALGVDIDLELVIKGLQNEKKGQPSPLSDTECIEGLSLAQKEAFEKQAKSNLEKAEGFLKENAKNKDVVVLEEGKVQYKIEKNGQGPAIDGHASPLIRYVGKYLDGSVFSSSTDPHMISLDESIQGFSKGLVGMKEGEKRTLYIHPEYGYGARGVFPPNSLLTYEIELVKAQADKERPDEALILESLQEPKSSSDWHAPAIR